MLQRKKLSEKKWLMSSSKTTLFPSRVVVRTDWPMSMFVLNWTANVCLASLKSIRTVSDTNLSNQTTHLVSARHFVRDHHFADNVGEDILFSNVKHLFFQPCDYELLVLIHIHFKNPVLIGKKKMKVWINVAYRINAHTEIWHSLLTGYPILSRGFRYTIRWDRKQKTTTYVWRWRWIGIRTGRASTTSKPEQGVQDFCRKDRWSSKYQA